MDDELEDKILYQTFVSHSKLLSKLIMSISYKCSYAAHFWRMLRIHALKPEIFLLTILIIIFVVYLHKADKHSQSLLSGITASIRQSALKFQNAQLRDVVEEASSNWECRSGNVAVFAVRGRRSHMEDRFVVTQNIRDTGVSLFAVFDGHGGEFAADYAKEHLVNNLTSRVIEIKNIIKDASIQENGGESYIQRKSSISLLENTAPHALKRKATIKRCSSQTDDTIKSDKNIGSVDADLLEKLEKFLPISRDMHLSRPDTKNDNAAIRVEAHVYVDNGDRINYGRLLTDEVLAADRLLVKAAKKNMNIAGTTALIALVEGTRLIVANVGDSRGVMCDNKGNAIPLSFDHKPQQMREKKRIQEAGGFIAFNGVWRVAGILATSRALGDYPLKERKLVIADPDILTFDLINYKPQFILLASDGLWDTFTNEEAIAFVKDRLHEPHFGAKSITMQSFYKGSLDNITVLVINLSNHNWTENDTSHNSVH